MKGRLLVGCAAVIASLWLVSAGGAALIVGTRGPDVLNGTAIGDQIYGRGGDDAVSGLGGGDLIRGNWGDDLLWGNEGNDTISGGPGDDRLRGNADNDVLYGDDGSDRMGGGNGRDTLYGGLGDDVLFARADDRLGDYLNCGPGFDQAFVRANDVAIGCEQVNVVTTGDDEAI